MPGYIIHLVEAEQILQNMPPEWRKYLPGGSISQSWYDAFICGVLLPDAAGKAEKRYTHYWRQEDIEKVVVVPHLEYFLQKYSGQLEQPVVLGYLAHLHLDCTFFLEYFHQRVRFLDTNGMETAERAKVAKAWLVEKDKEISLQQLFSGTYLYGDYTKLNALLIQRHGLHLPECPLTLDNPFRMDTETLARRALVEINCYLEESRNISEEPVLLSITSLEVFMSRTAKEFWQMLEEYQIKRRIQNG